MYTSPNRIYGLVGRRWYEGGDGVGRCMTVGKDADVGGGVGAGWQCGKPLMNCLPGRRAINTPAPIKPPIAVLGRCVVLLLLNEFCGC